MTSFWSNLPRPIFAMAPMADVTDAAFRRLIARHGPPHVFWTEFVSADGLHFTREVKKRHDDDNPLMGILARSEGDRPIVAQIFSAKQDMIAYGAELAERLGFDGVDLNMGCPDKTVEKQGSGASLIRKPALAAALLRAARAATRLPVSVKTRVGYESDGELEDWLTAVLEAGPAALTVHLRTREELSKVPADWSRMHRAVAVRDRVAPTVPILGNGDVRDLDEARARVVQTGCDGVMLGRALFGNPWLFAGRRPEDVSASERLAALIELADYFEALKPRRNFLILRKHVKAFVAGFDGAHDLRIRLMETESAAEMRAVLGAFDRF